MSQKILFVDRWGFSKHRIGTELENVINPTINWESVDLPHDWLIYNTNDLYETTQGWYRKTFHIEKYLDINRVFFRFDGVYMDCTIYINGTEAFEWKYGYSTFEFDATNYLMMGENEIYVRVIHECPNSRWYSGAGIYRKIWMKIKPNTYLVSDGIYIAPKLLEGQWKVEIETEIESIKSKQNVSIQHTILNKEGEIVLQSVGHCEVDHGCVKDCQKINMEQPIRWDLDHPYLYQCKTELIINGEVVDEEIQSFGFRTISFHHDNGFSLNGKRMKLNGVCQHHDLGCIGAAVNKMALRRQIKILKEMGVNSIRTAHNMPAKELMELADEMGVLILSESFDMWEKPKTTYDYARFFHEWKEKDVASWVRRDRNHPSLIMWSIGNEIYDTHAGERGQELTKTLMDLVHKHDSKHNAVVTIGSNYMPWENARKCADIVKVAGYNYAEKFYEKHHKDHPDWVIYGSETSSIVQSRGIYHFPACQSLLADDDEQCSSLGNSATSWGAKSLESCIIDDRDAEFSLGQYLWSGFDYIGEPTPYFTKNSYFGQVDTAGFKKDSFYLFQAEWTDYKENPMVHIFPYWDFNPGQIIDVRICSNAPKVGLFFNENLIGTYDIDHKKGKKLMGEWQLAYVPGTLRAEAYDEEGNVIATDCVCSFKDAKKIRLNPDKTTLEANGEDLIFVTITMEDEEEKEVVNANNRVNVCVTGVGRLIGLDNGDSTDFDQYKETSRRLFSGKLLAVIAAKQETGFIYMEVCSKGLKTETIELFAVPAKSEGTMAAYTENAISPQIDELPVRKIELICPEGTMLNQEKKSVPVMAKLYPVNATYQEVQWRVTNDAGIDINLATVEGNGQVAVVTALGDGEFHLRCTTKNGADKIRLISQMEFHAKGLGPAVLNPYEIISGGLYTRTNVELGNGNERGVSTPRDGISYVCFDGIDFGEFGSNELNISLFVLDSDPFPIQIWNGMPNEEGSEMLADVVYQKKSKWNTYQDEVFHLNRRVQGVSSICFVVTRKAHIKGFTFAKIKKAFETLSALENSTIYGDTYTICKDSIEGIGNNVSLVYEHMNFEENGCKKVIICGRSPIERNTIHIRFTSEEGENNQIAEFSFSEQYVEWEFDLETVKGDHSVTFVFLPGCNFDLKWIRFE